VQIQTPHSSGRYAVVRPDSQAAPHDIYAVHGIVISEREWGGFAVQGLLVSWAMPGYRGAPDLLMHADERLVSMHPTFNAADTAARQADQSEGRVQPPTSTPLARGLARSTRARGEADA
jgi:hypothetical protein